MQLLPLYVWYARAFASNSRLFEELFADSYEFKKKIPGKSLKFLRSFSLNGTPTYEAFSY